MQCLGDVFGRIRRLRLMPALAAVSIVFGVATVAQVAAQNAAPQTASVSPDDPKFAAFVYDVVSIKRNKGDDSSVMRMLPNGSVARNVSLRSFVATAYGVDSVSLHGTPDWLNREMYDIDAKMDPAVEDAYQKLSREERGRAFQHMWRVALEDRLNLRVHTEIKEGPAYALVIARGGLRIHHTAEPNATGGTFSLSSGEGGAVIVTGHGVQIQRLLPTLTSVVGAPVIDQTGLTDLFDFTLKFASTRMVAAAQPAGDSTPLPETAPQLPAAVQEQLGLKLESTKGPIKIAVIDHIERPSAN